MKNILLALLLLSVANLFSQIKTEIEAGGAGFLGLTANVEPTLWHSKNDLHFISMRIGVGALLPGYPEYPTAIIKSGISYYLGHWGLSLDVGGYTANPFFEIKRNTNFDDQIDMIIYPNIHHTFHYLNKTYLRISFGALFAYQREARNVSSESFSYPLVFQGDVIPGIGISFGGLFDK